MYSKVIRVIISFYLTLIVVESNEDSSEYGYLPKCPGMTKPVYVTPEAANKGTYVLLEVHEPATRNQLGYAHRRRYTLNRAARAIGTDPNVNFSKKKTMLFMDGYMDSGHAPSARFLMGDWASLGYNVILVDAQKLYSVTYPLSVRMSYPVGNYTAKFLKDLMPYGLKAEDLEMVGISLGGQVISLVSKYFYKFTGLKPKRLWAMDPGGPCFRSLSPEYILTPTDAHHVQVVHTGIDGFGIGKALGHVDFYVNGGEWQQIFNTGQPWAEELYSHVVSTLYLYSSLLRFPDKFVGIKCKNVQQAREHKCYDNAYPYETNVMGFKTDYSKPGIYYLPVQGQPPLYAEDGWMEKKIIYPNVYNDAMSEVEEFVLKKRSLDYNLSPPDVINGLLFQRSDKLIPK